jgi:hypothetical protein
LKRRVRIWDNFLTYNRNSTTEFDHICAGLAKKGFHFEDTYRYLREIQKKKKIGSHSDLMVFLVEELALEKERKQKDEKQQEVVNEFLDSLFVKNGLM